MMLCSVVIVNAFMVFLALVDKSWALKSDFHIHVQLTTPTMAPLPSFDPTFNEQNSAIATIHLTCPLNTISVSGSSGCLINPNETYRSYSTFFDYHNNSMLDSSSGYGCWFAAAADVNQYMTIDLSSVQTVTGVVTQARCTTLYVGNSYFGQFVKTYKVGYSTDGITFSYATSAAASHTFQGP
jgi:hypothetical protein